MKNQYVGDINDYAKYSLLRSLDDVLICWMLTPDDERSDGSLTGYLSQPQRYRHYDPELFDSLLRTFAESRNIQAIEHSGILPRARFFTAPLVENPPRRAEYFSSMFDACRLNDLVFFDPDNGLEVPSVPLGRKSSNRYLYWSELSATIEHGHSAIVYQHFPRANRDAYILRALESARGFHPELQHCAVFTSRVAYLFFLQPTHSNTLNAVRNFSSKWKSLIRYAE